MSSLGVSHNDFWNMPFFMVVDLLKRISPKKEEMPTRKQMLANMRYNRIHRGWV